MKRILPAAFALVLAVIPVIGYRSRELAEQEGASAVPPGYVAVCGRSSAGKIADAGTPAPASVNRFNMILATFVTPLSLHP